MQYGFITYYAGGERSSVFFHKSNTEGSAEGASLRVGDEVCFVVSTHPKTQKKQAICVKKTGLVQIHMAARCVCVCVRVCVVCVPACMLVWISVI